MSFKLAVVDEGGGVVMWSPGDALSFRLPRRCANAEIHCEWPSDDTRLTVSVATTTELSACENRVETGGAWLAYGRVGDEDGRSEALGASETSDGASEASDGAEEEEEDGAEVVGMEDDFDASVDRSVDEGEDGFLAMDSVDISVDLDAEEDDQDVGAVANDEGEYAYRPGDHVAEIGAMTGLNTEIVFNAANEEDFGVRIAILEEGELVELWHEHGTEPGKGMRVGDIYLGTVSKVISGMQGVLVDLTGKGPPYALMQKGIEQPALAWRLKEDSDGDDTERQSAQAPARAGSGWGSNSNSDADTVESTLETSADGRSYSRRLAARGAASASGGGVWRGVGGRSVRSSTLKKSSAQWIRWTPELNPEECSIAVPPPTDESNAPVDEVDDGRETEVVSAKVTRRKLREECYSMWSPGQPVVVQVTRLGSGYKGPRVTARPTLPGRNVVLCPDGEGVYVSRKLMGHARKYVKDVGATVCPEGSALIMRTEAAGVNQETLKLDISCLAEDWAEIVEKSEEAVRSSSPVAPLPRRLLQAASREQVLVRDLFGERVAKLIVDTEESYKIIIDDLMRSGASQAIIDRVVLHEGRESVFEALGVDEDIETMVGTERVFLGPELSGAHIVVQHTEALTAIDVNAGRTAMEAGEDGEAIALRVNIAAASLVARILRLRDIGGLVMVDLIDMHTDEARREVEKAFQAVACRDRAQVVFVPISALGVMEIARERLQTHALGKAAVIADEKGMPVMIPADATFISDKPPRRVRSVRGPRPPPWAASGGRGRGRGRGRSSKHRGDESRGDENSFI